MNTIALPNLLLILATASFASAPALAPAAHPLTPAAVAAPQAPNFGSDGSDAAFVFVPDAAYPNTMTIDLALAASGLDAQGQPITWQTPSPIAGRGVYDPSVWAVVFKYSSIDIPAGKAVVFTNHPSRAPVVWLSQGDVHIRGEVDVYGLGGYWGEPGPGGFRGAGSGAAGGFGPGGDCGGNYGNYANPALAPCARVYGSPSIFPLIGGSGGSTGNAGGGSGALLIASNALIQLHPSSLLWASPLGGSSSSGGAIRLVGDVIAEDVGAQVVAGNPSYGVGRIRIEANTVNGTIASTPPASIGTPGQIFPDSTTATVEVVSVTMGSATQSVPSDPRASFSTSHADVIVDAVGTATLNLRAHNVAPGRTCEVRVLQSIGLPVLYTSTPLVGTQVLSTATVQITLTTGVTAIQARVVL